MCPLHGADCNCESRVREVYRACCRAADHHDGAYLAAVGELRRLHPDLGALAALTAVRDALAAEQDTGIVDCGPLDGHAATTPGAGRRRA